MVVQKERGQPAMLRS